MSANQQYTASAIAHLDLYNEWFKHKRLKRSELCFRLREFVRTKVAVDESSADEKITKFLKNVEPRWNKCHRMDSRFQTMNEDWLRQEVFFMQQDSVSEEPGTSRGPGRPTKTFEESGSRGKQMKARKLWEGKSVEELSLATQQRLRKCGKRSAALVLRDITNSPKRAQKYRKVYRSSESSSNKAVVYSAEEALALIINAKLSKHQYLLIRSEAKSRNVKIYPSWHSILEAKQKCYPNISSTNIDELSAQVKLQNILDITTERICLVQEDVLKTIPSSVKNLTLLCKWGCDGSSGQSNYKQRYTLKGQVDSSVFIISFVPLQLYYTLKDKVEDRVIVWQNPCPSSTRFCRPIKFIFKSESTDTTRQETDEINRQILELHPKALENGTAINYELLLTMVDGKVCSALTETKSSQVCYICKAKPSEMNDIDKVTKKNPEERNFSFGLSTLHAWIRFFECCLHISYRLEVRSWQARGILKNKVEHRKKEIIEKLRQELGLLVDQPKPGFGSTNDGNTARTFFHNPRLVSEITGVDEKLIERFSVILKTISSGFQVNPDKFDMYAKQTARHFVDKYPWFYMPLSVHKVLIHGSEVIKHFILPIGQLSEEAQEARNKDFKFIREHHTRKMSRVSTNEDLFKTLLLSSDPVISTISRKRLVCHKKNSLPPAVLELLSEPTVPQIESDDE